MFSKIDQFAPDADPTTPGIFTDVANLIPTAKGYKVAPAAYDPGVTVLPAAVLSSANVRKLDNSTRLLAGTTTKIYEISGTSWEDRSSSTYNATTDSAWSFAQFGNVTLASTKGDYIQYSNATAGFATISGAPKASHIETVNQFVIAADTNDASFGDSPDRWWCCAVGDYTSWTPNTATQCVSGRLTSAPGRINAFKRLGDAVVAYKDRSMFIGSYVGAPEVWQFQEVPGRIGCLAKGGVASIGAALHIFIGEDNFYMYDGSRPVPIGNPIKDWFYARLSITHANRIKSLVDLKNSCVFFFYPSTSGGGVLDSCVVYNYRQNKWGVSDRTIEATVEYVASGLTFDGSYSSTTTWATTALTWDSNLLNSGSSAPAYFDTSHKIYILTGTGGSWSFTTGEFGDDSEVSTTTRMKPRFLTAPTSATCQNAYKMNHGDAFTLDTVRTYSNGRFDFIRSSRWHKFIVQGTGHMEISGLNLDGVKSGDE